MRHLFFVLLISMFSLSVFAETSLIGAWKGPTYRCQSGAVPKSFGISTSETLTFTDTTASVEMTVVINGSACRVKASGTYSFVNGLLSTVGTSISAEGPGCRGTPTLGSSQTPIEVVGNELRETMPGPNMACPEGDTLISVLVKQ